jgi:hypothetical protein
VKRRTFLKAAGAAFLAPLARFFPEPAKKIFYAMDIGATRMDPTAVVEIAYDEIGATEMASITDRHADIPWPRTQVIRRRSRDGKILSIHTPAS